MTKTIEGYWSPFIHPDSPAPTKFRLNMLVHEGDPRSLMEKRGFTVLLDIRQPDGWQCLYLLHPGNAQEAVAALYAHNATQPPPAWDDIQATTDEWPGVERT
jgi:hypothetical protein